MEGDEAPSEAAMRYMAGWLEAIRKRGPIRSHFLVGQTEGGALEVVEGEFVIPELVEVKDV